jgi:hypothetical protein
MSAPKSPTISTRNRSIDAGSRHQNTSFLPARKASLPQITKSTIDGDAIFTRNQSSDTCMKPPIFDESPKPSTRKSVHIMRKIVNVGRAADHLAKQAHEKPRNPGSSPRAAKLKIPLQKLTVAQLRIPQRQRKAPKSRSPKANERHYLFEFNMDVITDQTKTIDQQLAQPLTNANLMLYRSLMKSRWDRVPMPAPISRQSLDLPTKTGPSLPPKPKEAPHPNSLHVSGHKTPWLTPKSTGEPSKAMHDRQTPFLVNDHPQGRHALWVPSPHRRLNVRMDIITPEASKLANRSLLLA